MLPAALVTKEISPKQDHQRFQLWMKDPERFQIDSVNWLNYLT